MILQLDHVALSSCDINSDIELFQRRGYRLRFLEQGVPNPKIKKGLLHRYSARHDLAFLEGEEGYTRIELIHHGSVSSVDAYLSPVSSDSSKDFHGDAFSIHVSALGPSVAFWQLFGFFVIHSEVGRVQMRVRLPLDKHPFDLILVEDGADTHMSSLDDRGFHAIAFASSDARRERDHFERLGYEVTSMDTVVIQQKRLNLFFVVGPSHELVEVFSLER